MFRCVNPDATKVTEDCTVNLKIRLVIRTHAETVELASRNLSTMKFNGPAFVMIPTQARRVNTTLLKCAGQMASTTSCLVSASVSSAIWVNTNDIFIPSKFLALFRSGKCDCSSA